MRPVFKWQQFFVSAFFPCSSFIYVLHRKICSAAGIFKGLVYWCVDIFVENFLQNFTTLKLPRQWFTSLQNEYFHVPLDFVLVECPATSFKHNIQKIIWDVMYFFYVLLVRFKLMYLSWIISWFCHLFNFQYKKNCMESILKKFTSIIIPHE